MQEQTQDKKTRKFNVVYSQFISVDVNPAGQPPKYVKAIRQEDFDKWVLENKNTKLCGMDYFLAHPKIMEWLGECLQMKIEGWEIQNFLVQQGSHLHL